MAFIESGTLGGFPAVSECLAHPSLYPDSGVYDVAKMRLPTGDMEEVTTVPPVQLGDYVFKLFRHPELLVPDTCRLWHEEYRVLSKYGARIEYDDFHPCYLQAEKIFTNYVRATNGRTSDQAEIYN